MRLFETDTCRRRREERERQQSETLQAAAELANSEEKNDLTDTQLISLDEIIAHVEKGDKRWNNIKRH